MNKAQSDPFEEDSPFDSDELNTNRKVRSHEEEKEPFKLMSSESEKGTMSMVAAQILMYTFGLKEKDLSANIPPQPLCKAPKRFMNLLSSQDYESELCKSRKSSSGQRVRNLALNRKKKESGSSQPNQPELINGTSVSRYL